MIFSVSNTKQADCESALDVISDKEKHELRQLAASKAVRAEFRILRQYSLRRRPVDLDEYIRFLTTISRLISRPTRQRVFVQYTQVKL
jgi:hypothetical protein